MTETTSTSGSCCSVHAKPEPAIAGGCCGAPRRRFDWLLWGSLSLVVLGYGMHLASPALDLGERAGHFAHGVFDFFNTMWWGLVAGVFFVGLLGKVPRELVMKALGRGGTFGGLVRATGAGLAFDLCSHGILLVGFRLYERGASLGQTMAFLIASPWNSLSLTIILVALVGLGWTLAFLILSAVIALISGVIFDRLVARGVLPDNPHKLPAGESLDFNLWGEVARRLRGVNWSPALAGDIIRDGVKESRMILRWMMFGIVLAAALRATLSPEDFQAWFGPSLVGLAATLIATTLLEACSEGSSPIAADLLNRAGAPGNAFTFLMAGVATDYTEIMGIKERTRSWRIALFLPLVTVPQILAISIVMNVFGSN